MRWSGFAAGIVACVLMIAACGSATSPDASGSGGTAAASAEGSAGASAGTACSVAPDGTTAAATVTIRDFVFDPPSVTVKAGEAVAWTNVDAATHDVATVDGSCDTGRITRGATVALVFPAAGTYTYHCTIHASMPEATVVVTP